MGVEWLVASFVWLDSALRQRESGGVRGSFWIGLRVDGRVGCSKRSGSRGG